HRLVAPLERARSMDHEYDGDVPQALTVLAGALNSNAEEEDEIEDLLADAVRLAVQAGELGTAQVLERRAAAYAAGSHIPHREADVLYCRGLVDHDTSRLLAAAERYDDAGRPLQKAKALEAAAEEFIGAGDRDQARAAFTRAGDVYGTLGAAADIARL